MCVRLCYALETSWLDVCSALETLWLDELHILFIWLDQNSRQRALFNIQLCSVVDNPIFLKLSLVTETTEICSSLPV